MGGRLRNLCNWIASAIVSVYRLLAVQEDEAKRLAASDDATGKGRASRDEQSGWPATPDARSSDESSPASGASLSYPARFSWPLRLFLVAFVFDMVVRSAISLTPYDDDWRKDLAMERYPVALPTQQELRKIRNGRDIRYDSVGERYAKVGASLWDYILPWPDKKAGEQIDNATDVGRFCLVWLGTRLSFAGALLGLDQNWPMFAPNVRSSRILPRAKLIFEDGSSKELWMLAEPWDVTSYSRWFIKRPLQIDIRLHQDFDARLGVSQHLARLHPESERGSPLRFIELHKVSYTLPKPSQDAYRVLSQQNQKPLEDDPFWRYDVIEERGKTLQDKYEKERRESERKRRQKSNKAPVHPESAP